MFTYLLSKFNRGCKIPLMHREILAFFAEMCIEQGRILDGYSKATSEMSIKKAVRLFDGDSKAPRKRPTCGEASCVWGL